MGLFDNIKKKIGAAANEYQNASEEGMAQDILTLAETLKNAKTIELAGYKSAFRDKCENLSSAELKNLYNEITGKNKPGIHINLSLKTNHAAEIIGDILVQRGVFTRDENGVICE